MPAGEVDVELVIQTATGLLTGRFGAREAVTILASHVPRACAEAEVLARRQPERSSIYAELLRSIRAELLDRDHPGEEGRNLRAVVEDLDRLAAALAT